MATMRAWLVIFSIVAVFFGGALAPALAQSDTPRPGTCTGEDCLPSIEESLRSIAVSLKLLAEQGRTEGLLASYRAADLAVRELEAQRLAAVKERADLVGELDAELLGLEKLEEAADNDEGLLPKQQIENMIASKLRTLQPVEKKIDALTDYIRGLDDEIAIKTDERNNLRDRLQNVR